MIADDEGMSTTSKTAEVLVVGAGIAGLRAGRSLAEAGREVVVLEKSRGFGGRAATKRLHGTQADHGAQYFTVRDARLQRQVDAWLGSGLVRVWTRGFHRLTASGLESPGEGHPRYAFPGGMSTFGKLLGEGLDVRREVLVTGLAKAPGGWLVRSADGGAYTAETVLLNLPAPQASVLGRDVFSPETITALSRVAFAPCLALVAGYDQAPPEWSGIEAEDGPVSWLASDASKRGERGETTLVLHGSETFSQRHLETPETALPEMLSLAASLGFTDPEWTQLHRWRYAKATKPYDKPFLQAAEGLFLCGDWCGGAKVEAAYVSGLGVAEAVLESA